MRHPGASFTRLTLVLVAVITVTACSHVTPDTRETDALNATAHRWRYRNIDSLRCYALRALERCPEGYDAGRGEALNHLAYERAQRLDFDSALSLTNAVLALERAPAEQAIADIMAMKVAQRTSDNVAFFTHRAHAAQRLADLDGRTLSDHAAARRLFANGEMHIVASTYFYYVDQLERARDEIAAAEPFCQMQEDTAQWLNYCYMCGSGGLVDSPDMSEVTRREFDFLFKCFTFSKNNGYLYFEANALQSLATLLDDTTRVSILQTHKPEALIYLDIIFPQPSSVAMAEEAVALFRRYDDAFQTANALRTQGTLAAANGDFAEALRRYGEALALVEGAYVPEWEAGIWEKMSVALAGEGDFEGSAMARNRYLDLRYLTREDAEWTSRAELLREESASLRRRIMATILLALVMAALVLVLRQWWLRRNDERLRRATEEHQRLMAEAEARTSALTDAEEQLREERAATQLRIQRARRQNVVQRAKLNLVREIMPLLDRIVHAVRQMQRHGQSKPQTLQYICELTESIDEKGQLLTEWIQMERGRVNPSITSFAIEPLFATLRRSAFAFSQRGIDLCVTPTDLSVKADKALTFFMLNTLADNARKHTPEGGRVTIQADEGSSDEGSYVELSVTDTGCGLSAEQQETILSGRADMHDGHGFGLMNCRGIIERYRKTSRHFAVAAMGVESRVGQGSRFWLRLPKAAMHVIVTVLVVTSSTLTAWASTDSANIDDLRAAAYRLADSLYFANVDGRHDDAMRHAAAVMTAVNAWHDAIVGAKAVSQTADTLRLTLFPTDDEAADVQWLVRGDSLDYELLLGIRNETAVAALATRQWGIYTYNNRVYTRLFKLYNHDATLEADCARLESAQRGQRLTLWLMAVIIIIALVAAYVLWLRPRMMLRRKLDELRRQRYANDLAEEQRRELSHQSDVEMAEDEHRRRLYEESRLHVQNQIMDNCLSTIKHETLYYPGRIRRIAQQTAQTAQDDVTRLATLCETATYCREVYATFLAQGEQQASQMPLRITSVERHGVTVRADAELLDMLLETLLAFERKTTSAQDISLSAEGDADARFARFIVTNATCPLTPAQCDELFAPHEGGFDLLIAKQIMRELDTALGHIGCRIQAQPTPDAQGHLIWFTLPLSTPLQH